MEILLVCKKRGGGMFQTVTVRGAGGRAHKFSRDPVTGEHVLRCRSVEEFHEVEENLRNSRLSGSIIVTRILPDAPVQASGPDQSARIAELEAEIEAYRTAAAIGASKRRPARRADDDPQ